MSKGQKSWDVVVVGGGPAGMMAAASAGARGLNVILLEKNKTLGVKLRITGGGRCNVTNNKPVIRDMLAKYKKSDKFLFSAFSQFGVTNALDFFHSHHMSTKEENEGRVFPTSNSAQSVWEVLVGALQKTGVVVQTNAKVKKISKDEKVFTVALSSGLSVEANSCVIATGGMSHPETGSTGDGYQWMQALGHTIKVNDVALVPVALKDVWVKKLAGVTLPHIKLTVFQNGEKKLVETGKILFTHFGVSGPTILNMSRDIGEWSQYGQVQILLDLFVTQDHAQLKEQLQTLLVSESNKKIKNILGTLIPKALVAPVLTLASVNPDTFSHSVRSEERIKIIALLKALPLNVKGLLGADRAVVSSGGVMPEEVDFKTMQSRLVPNLFIIGDMLNIDRPSGGYSLQLCWTTGFVAGSHA